MKGSGDRLASGAPRASFTMHDGHLKDKKWNDAFNHFDPEKFKKAPNKSMMRTPTQLQLPLE